MIEIQRYSVTKKGKKWPHRHKWVSIEDHPAGGALAFAFMLETDEQKRVEMCLTCPARKVNKKEI